jgi:hypothetical protein
MKTKSGKLSGTIPVVIGLILVMASSSNLWGQRSYECFSKENAKMLHCLIKGMSQYDVSQYLLVLNSPVFTAEGNFEGIPAMEYWMVDMECWLSHPNSSLNSLLCVEEVEQPLSVESWMLQDLTSHVTDTDAPAADSEDALPLEKWMTDPKEWESRN